MFFQATISLFGALVRVLMWKVLRTDLERELFILLKENQMLKRKRRSVCLTPGGQALLSAEAFDNPIGGILWA